MVLSRTVCLGLGGGDPANYSQPGQLWAPGVCMGSLWSVALEQSGLGPARVS